MIRFISIMTTLFLYLLFGIPVLGVEWLIGKFNKNTEDYQCLRMVQRAFKLMISMAGTYNGKGHRKYPKGSVGALCGQPQKLL